MHTETKLNAECEQLLQCAIQAQQNDQAENALKQYQRILKQYPKHSMIHHLIGITFAQLNQIDDAVNYFKQAIQYQPNHPIYIASLANALRRKNQLVEATELFKQALTINPSLVSAHNNLALIYFSNNPEKAREHFEKALEIRPEHIDANYNLGLLHAQNNKHKAMQYFQRVIQLSPDHLGAVFQMAQCYHADKAYIKAKSLYEKILRIQPNDPECLNKLGLLHLEQDDFNQGLDHLQQAVKIDPNIEEINHNLACCYLHQKKYQQALEYWLKHLKVNKDLDTYYNIGVCYLYLGRYEDCTDQLFHVIKQDPLHYQALINLGAAFLQKGQPSLACEYYEKAQKIKPTTSIAYILTALQQKKSPETAPEDYVTDLFDNYAHHYDNHLCDVLSYSVPERLKQLLTVQLNLKEKSQKALDLGCGTGLSGQAVSAFCHTLTGIDLSENMLEQARKKEIYDRLIHGNILTMHQELTKQHDLIICADTIPYFGALEKLFQTVKDYLKAQGIWVFTIESHYQTDYQLTESARYTHSPDYIKTCARKHGFEIIHSENLHLRSQQKSQIEGMVFIIRLNENRMPI